jgi:hypothetical protein
MDEQLALAIVGLIAAAVTAFIQYFKAKDEQAAKEIGYSQGDAAFAMLQSKLGLMKGLADLFPFLQPYYIDVQDIVDEAQKGWENDAFTNAQMDMVKFKLEFIIAQAQKDIEKLKQKKAEVAAAVVAPVPA